LSFLSASFAVIGTNPAAKYGAVFQGGASTVVNLQPAAETPKTIGNIFFDGKKGNLLRSPTHPRALCGLSRMFSPQALVV